MATSGPRSPGTIEDYDQFVSGLAWSNPSNAASSNNVYSTMAVTSSDPRGSSLLAYNFGFPTLSGTLDGILIEVEGKTSVSSCDVKACITTNAGSPWSAAISGGSLSTSEAYVSVGGPTELFDFNGDIYTLADVSSASFGCRVDFWNNLSSNMTLSVDHIRMTIYYTAGGIAKSCSASGNFKNMSGGFING